MPKTVKRRQVDNFVTMQYQFGHIFEFVEYIDDGDEIFDVSVGSR